MSSGGGARPDRAGGMNAEKKKQRKNTEMKKSGKVRR
jgi:hypothetical protein